MKPVRITKYFSLKQLQNMSDNLRDKFNCYTSLEVNARSYTNTIHNKHLEVCYHLYKAFSSGMTSLIKDYKTWEELQQQYLKLMKEE